MTSPIDWGDDQPEQVPPARHAADTINDDDLDQLSARIETLEHVAAGNKRHVQLIVPDLEAALARAEQAEAALEQAKRNQLGDFEAISYWTHQTQLARDYSQHDSRALAATVVQARRWATRAEQAEATIARVRAYLEPRTNCVAVDPCDVLNALDEPKEPRT